MAKGGPRLDLVWLPWASNWADFLAPGVFRGLRTMGIFSKFSENFDFLPFSAIPDKADRTGTRHLVNKLILENA